MIDPQTAQPGNLPYAVKHITPKKPKTCPGKDLDRSCKPQGTAVQLRGKEIGMLAGAPSSMLRPWWRYGGRNACTGTIRVEAYMPRAGVSGVLYVTFPRTYAGCSQPSINLVRWKPESLLIIDPPSPPRLSAGQQFEGGGGLPIRNVAALSFEAR